MVAVPRSGVPLAAAIFVLLAAFVFTMPPARATQTSVFDETGLMSSAAIAQIDARNEQLYGATGRIVVVAVVRGDNGATALTDGTAIADRLAKGRYGAIVWVATGPAQTNILFGGRALKWVPYDEQISLQRDLVDTIRFCCPSDTLPAIVDQIASAMETGSRVAPSPNNYVRDRLGVLNDQQTANLVARDQRLEAATGKGIAIVLFPEQPGQPSPELAYAMAESQNVNGQIAAVVWLDRGPTASHFAVIQTPGFDTVPQASIESISATFQADMQTGNFGDAIVAAVDRTATAIEGTSTPMPTLPPEPQEVVSALPGVPASPPGTQLLRSLPGQGASSAGTAIAIFVAFGIVVIFVTMALRRERDA